MEICSLWPVVDFICPHNVWPIVRVLPIAVLPSRTSWPKPLAMYSWLCSHGNVTVDIVYSF